jgi:hypothetical protein
MAFFACHSNLRVVCRFLIFQAWEYNVRLAFELRVRPACLRW